MKFNYTTFVHYDILSISFNRIIYIRTYIKYCKYTWWKTMHKYMSICLYTKWRNFRIWDSKATFLISNMLGNYIFGKEKPKTILKYICTYNINKAQWYKRGLEALRSQKCLVFLIFVNFKAEVYELRKPYLNALFYHTTKCLYIKYNSSFMAYFIKLNKYCVYFNIISSIYDNFIN